MKIRLVILWAVALVGLAFVNYSIYGKEQLIHDGEPLFLELAPVDPRSLIQGDYMALRYRMAVELEGEEALPPRGTLVVRRDERDVATFVRLDYGITPLAADERRLKYYLRDQQVEIGPNAFFFQEGNREVYQNARYGELHVDSAGNAVLVGLRGPDLEPLAPTPQAK
ncbi:MAG: GDYXXLXY domain-containing protein [Caldilineaceae bacterium]